MTDRLDTIRKRLASGSPFTPHAGDLAWAIAEIDRLKGENERLAKERDALVGASVVCPMGHGKTVDAMVDAELRAFNVSSEIARLDALSRATADAEAADEEANS